MVDAADDPDIPVPGADRRALAIRREIKGGGAHPSAPGIVERYGDGIDDVRAFAGGEFASGGDGFIPARRAAGNEFAQVDGFAA